MSIINRNNFENYIFDTYNVTPDFPWKKYPNFATFRHSNGKCFAIVMDLNKEKFGLTGDKIISVVNLKNSPLMIGSLTCENGIFPAYHMNKEHWISVFLDDSVPDDKIKLLLDISFNFTK